MDGVYAHLWIFLKALSFAHMLASCWTTKFACSIYLPLLFLNIQMANQKAKYNPAADIYYADLNLFDSVENEKLNQGIDLLDEYRNITSKHWYIL